MHLPKDTNLGELRLRDVYEYYDGPRLFSCEDLTDQLFLAISVEDTEDISRWLYCPISQRRLSGLEQGKIDLRTIFSDAETGHLHQVVTSPDRDSATMISTSMLEESDLPLPSEYLNYTEQHVDTLAPVAPVHARQSRRETLRLSLSPRHAIGNEAPSRLVGQVLVYVQELVSAIGQTLLSTPTTRGRLPPEVLEATELQAVTAFAGSYGIELASAQTSDLFGESALARTLHRLDELVEADDDLENLTRLLEQLRPRVASKYTRLISLLDDATSGITVDWGSVRQDWGSFRILKPEQVSRISMALAMTEAAESSEYLVTGVLVGLNTRTRSFELRARSDGHRVSGRLDSSRIESDEEFTINGLYEAKIRETIEVSGLTGEESITRQLLELNEKGLSE